MKKVTRRQTFVFKQLSSWEELLYRSNLFCPRVRQRLESEHLITCRMDDQEETRRFLLP